MGDSGDLIEKGDRILRNVAIASILGFGLRKSLPRMVGSHAVVVLVRVCEIVTVCEPSQPPILSLD